MFMNLPTKSPDRSQLLQTLCKIIEIPQCGIPGLLSKRRTNAESQFDAWKTFLFRTYRSGIQNLKIKAST